MDVKKTYKQAAKKIAKGASDTNVRELLSVAGLTVYEADQFILREKTKRSFFPIRWSAMLMATYVWAALLYLGLYTAGLYAELSIQRQSVNIATFALALFVVSLLFRPKPQGRGVRALFTTIELAFPGALIALSVVLFQHPGWPLPNLPDGGAFASTLWPFLWIGAWLGPQILAVLILFIGHYGLLNIRTSYFLNRQNLLLEQRKEALRGHYQTAIEQAGFVPAAQVANLAQKVVKLLMSNNDWNPKSTIEIYSIGQQIHVQPLGGGAAVLTSSAMLSPAFTEESQATHETDTVQKLNVASLELAGYNAQMAR